MTIQTCSDMFACLVIPGEFDTKPGRTAGHYLHARRAAVDVSGSLTVIGQALVRDLPRRHMAGRLAKGVQIPCIAQWMGGFLIIHGPASQADLDAQAVATKGNVCARRFLHQKHEARIKAIHADWQRLDDAAAQIAA